DGGHRHALRLLRHAADADGGELQSGSGGVAGTEGCQRRDPPAGVDGAAAVRLQRPADVRDHFPVRARSAVPVVLLTGFAPFAGETANPSWLAVRALHGRRIAGHRIVARELPVEFGAALKVLRAQLRALRPALVIAVGQAGCRAALSLERVAINIEDRKSG